ncbi:MAG: HNH endonuclease [Balneolales bacterium]
MEKLPFIPKQIYKRSLLHDQYGGSRQSGISPTANYPWIFIFSGAAGQQHGYKDRWENKNVFSYTGEGQVGDMEFTRGNLALRNHLQNGKRVFLFEYVQTGRVMFISELTFIDADYFETHDRDGDLRIAIKFFFKRVGVNLDINLEDLDQIAPTISHKDLLQPFIQEPDTQYDYLRPSVTERSGLVTSRVGQGAYRKSILHRWEYKCAITQFDDISILIASHIVPWKDATDEERLDVENGILLSPTYDALFDQHIITFDNKGDIILSNSIELAAYQKIGVTGGECLCALSDGMVGYLDEHQKEFQTKSHPTL